LKLLLLALLGWSLGGWCVFVFLRGLRIGEISFRRSTYYRRRNPFMFWYCMVASGLGGVFLILAIGYLVMNP
jgi:hypothetical protein